MTIRNLNPASVDVSSFCDLNAFRTSFIEIDWDVDFVRERISGFVLIHLDILDVSMRTVVLDTRNLEISSVSISDKSVDFLLDEENTHPVLGTPLRIYLPETEKNSVCLKISYCTGSGGALQWLRPEMTNSKKMGFVFSQSQAIHARSLLPCQDVCSAKAAYSARVRAPGNSKVLMSAVETVSRKIGDLIEWNFRQNVPIPPYLIAIACGELSSQKLGPRCRVWSEPGILDRAAWEFADTEKILCAAEEICGPYKFGIYDLLVLPSSFPYGGMENPCLTFVTPTLISGDRSLVSVVAHEIAHSWSGNLVTNANWEHFWLNEGLTVFIEEKIINKLWGREAAHLHTLEGWLSLDSAVSEQFSPLHNFTCLCTDLKGGIDPDDAFSSVPYYKGAALFYFLQNEVLKCENRMEFFLKAYFTEFAFRCVTSEDFKTFFCSMFSEGKNIEWLEWFSQPGLPPYRPPTDPLYSEEAINLAEIWLRAAKDESVSWPEPGNFKSWPSLKKCIFLKNLKNLSECKKASEAAEILLNIYELSKANAEIQTAYLLIALPCKTSLAVEMAKKLLVSQGRMKFTRPVYKALAESWGIENTRNFFNSVKNTYHPICSKMISKDLK